VQRSDIKRLGGVSEAASPRPPHIVTFDEEEKILTAAVPYIRVLVVLILETGMRSHREALALRWDAIDFTNDSIRVRDRKHALASETSRCQPGVRTSFCAGAK
jgi:integrase